MGNSIVESCANAGFLLALPVLRFAASAAGSAQLRTPVRAGSEAPLEPHSLPARSNTSSAFCQQKSTHKGCYFVGAERGIRSRARRARSGRSSGAPLALHSLLRPSNPSPFHVTKRAPELGAHFVGAERGIRTLDTIPSIHDFQSCALDQLSHLCKVRWV